MATRTRAELVNLALEKLGELAVLQTAPQESYAYVNANVPSLADYLARAEIYEINNLEEIDAAAFNPLSILLADMCKEPYGAGPFETEKAEWQLRRISAASPTYEKLKVEYF